MSEQPTQAGEEPTPAELLAAARHWAETGEVVPGGIYPPTMIHGLIALVDEQREVLASLQRMAKQDLEHVKSANDSRQYMLGQKLAAESRIRELERELAEARLAQFEAEQFANANITDRERLYKAVKDVWQGRAEAAETEASTLSARAETARGEALEAAAKIIDANPDANGSRLIRALITAPPPPADRYPRCERCGLSEAMCTLTQCPLLDGGHPDE